VQRQDRYGFSQIACDQTIEQTINRESKGRGGISGISLNRGTVKRWILTQPQRAEIARKCEDMAGMMDDGRTKKDLDMTSKVKNEELVIKVMDSIRQMSNPFDGSHTELVNIMSGTIASSECTQDLLNAYSYGESRREEFVTKRLFEKNDDRFFDTITKSKLLTFSSKKRTKSTITPAPERKIFSRLLLLGDKTDMDLKTVMKYSLGNVSFPLASEDGGLCTTPKSKLRHHLLKEYPSDSINPPKGPTCAVIIDGMGIVQGLSPRALPATWELFARKILEICLAKGKECGRLDIVFDRYPEVSIKNLTHRKRAGGESSSAERRILNPESALPKGWKSFLTNGRNKENLIEFLFRQWSAYTLCSEMKVFIRHGTLCHQLLGAGNTMLINDLETDQEEADTMLLLHAHHAGREFSHILIHSEDTDVFVLALAHSGHFDSLSVIFCGPAGKKICIDICQLASDIGRMLPCLIGLHTFTGCDSTSAFHGKGKSRPYDLIRNLNDNDLEEAFSDLGSSWDDLRPETMAKLEEFVCKLYGYNDESVDTTRYHSFLSKALNEKKMPPTLDSLMLHIRRANYQARIHKLALQAITNAPSPSNHGWTIIQGELEVKWMTLDPAPNALLNVSKCRCRVTKCRTNQCSCRAANVSCIEICVCVDCDNCEDTPAENDIMNDDSEDDLYEDDDTYLN
jgi:hypothetical protein